MTDRVKPSNVNAWCPGEPKKVLQTIAGRSSGGGFPDAFISIISDMFGQKRKKPQTRMIFVTIPPARLKKSTV